MSSYVLLGIILCVLLVWWWHRVCMRSPVETADTLHHAEPPRPRSAVRHYERAVARNHPEALLPLATLYHYGLPEGREPLPPNPALAVQYYEQAALMADVQDQVQARERLAEMRIIPPPPPAHVHLVVVQPPKTPKHVPRSDSQNVHDSGVVRSISVSLSKLPEPHLSPTDALGAARRMCTGKPGAMAVIDQMERNTTPLTSVGMTETEVLRRVVSRIEAANEDKRKDMSTMLALELQACADGNTCSGGRVARVVDSLSVLDEAVVIKPSWALRQEMMALASTMGDDAFDADRLRQKMHDAYVKPGLASAEFVDAEIASWAL